MAQRNPVAPLAVMVASSTPTHTQTPAQSGQPQPSPSTERLLSRKPRRFRPYDPNPRIPADVSAARPAMLNRQSATQIRSHATPTPRRLHAILPPSTPSTNSSLPRRSEPTAPDDEQRGRPRRQTPPVIEIHECDENPAFFPGHTNIVGAWQDQEDGLLPRPVHSPKLGVCQNRANHPRGPYYVCQTCYQLAWLHLKATNPNLFKVKYIKLCNKCGQRHLEEQEEKKRGGQRLILGCICPGTSKVAKCLCFDCMESALMRAKARWDGELEYRTKYMTSRAEEYRTGSFILGCRCSIDVLEWKEMERTQALERFFVCPGCEGIDVKGPMENATEAVLPPSATRDIQMNERGNESNGTQHGAGSRRVPQPQSNEDENGEAYPGGETSEIMEASGLHPERHMVDKGGRREEKSATKVAYSGPNGGLGLQSMPERRSEQQDGRFRPEGNVHVALGTKDSDSEYEPEAINDNDSLSMTSVVSH